MTRPTDEELYTRFLSASLAGHRANPSITQEDAKVMQWAADDATAMLAKHRERFPAQPADPNANDPASDINQILWIARRWDEMNR